MKETDANEMNKAKRPIRFASERANKRYIDSCGKTICYVFTLDGWLAYRYTRSVPQTDTHTRAKAISAHRSAYLHQFY